MRRNPIYWLLLALAGLFLVRLSLMNDYLGFSADIGSYLMTRNWILGNDLPMPTLHIRPPLIAVYLLPFTETLGDLEGSKVAALFSSVLLGADLTPENSNSGKESPPGKLGHSKEGSWHGRGTQRSRS